MLHLARKPVIAITIGSLGLLVGLMLTACSKSTTPQCTGGTQSYKGNCLSATAVTYMKCTEGRGMSTTTGIGGSLGGSFKVVADASVKAAYTRSKQEDTPVALEIVRDCLKIATTAPSATSEAAVAASYESQVQQYITAFQQDQVAQTPHIALSQSQAAIGQSVQVSGSGFWPNETVDIDVGAILIKQVTTDSTGHFTSLITIPQGAPPPDFPTEISAGGESSAKSASAPFST
jgi:hypothetical protein